VLPRKGLFPQNDDITTFGTKVTDIHTTSATKLSRGMAAVAAAMMAEIVAAAPPPPFPPLLHMDRGCIDKIKFTKNKM
jgi:hypothetical protein